MLPIISVNVVDFLSLIAIMATKMEAEEWHCPQHFVTSAQPPSEPLLTNQFFGALACSAHKDIYFVHINSYVNIKLIWWPSVVAWYQQE